MLNSSKTADFSGFKSRSYFEARNTPIEDHLPKSIYESLCSAADQHGSRPAISFQLNGHPNCPAVTYDWARLADQALRCGAAFRSHGVDEAQRVAYLLPNLPETVITFLAGMLAGTVVPINPLLEPSQIAAILQETNACTVVTLKPIPGIEIAQKAALAVTQAPSVKTVIEVDVAPYLGPFKRSIVMLARPRVHYRPDVVRLNFADTLSRFPATPPEVHGQSDRVIACFHTGGTTGNPKVVQHVESGVLFTGWLGAQLLFDANSVALCPLPLFHVFGCHAVLMSAVQAGAHVVLPSPAGFRGDGVLTHFWKLIERWQATFVISVPTAMSAMLQTPIDADVSSVDLVLSGSAPLPKALYERFERETGIEVVEGYGMTEATALVAANPIGGTKKIGSVGIPFPFVDLRVCRNDGETWRDCETDEVGEICVAGPAIHPNALFLNGQNGPSTDAGLLRTGDLGRLDVDGYLWITGRAKDLIIRGGHNIDPSVIEEPLSTHEAVDLVAAVAQPDAHAGEVPCVYVTTLEGYNVSVEALHAFAVENIAERAALPRHIEILPAMPQTAVGKVSKLDLRKMAIQRVFDESLRLADLPYRTTAVSNDKKNGMVAELNAVNETDRDTVDRILGAFPVGWR
ncbi:MAG: acyl-CoA synthetase [Pseudomonadota bacterium]